MVAAMTYGERIRHPSGALSKQDETRKKSWRLLVLGAIVAGAIYFAWRMGWFGKIAAAGAKAAGAVKPIANPHGWV